MKKTILFAVSAITTILLLSCSTDAEQLCNDKLTEQEPVSEIVNRLNAANPHSTLGIMHNEVLRDLGSQLDLKTRTSPGNPLDALREEAIRQYKSLHDTVMTLPEFLAYYDSILPKAFLPENPIQMFAVDLSPQEKATFTMARQDLDSVMFDNDNSITSLLSRVETIQNTILSCPASDDREELLSVASVATNSLDYWHAEKMVSGLNISSEWKNAAKADYKAGKYTSKVARYFGVWGWVGAAVITGVASYIGYNY